MPDITIRLTAAQGRRVEAALRARTPWYRDGSDTRTLQSLAAEQFMETIKQITQSHEESEATRTIAPL
jgi:hypothetical protein